MNGWRMTDMEPADRPRERLAVIGSGALSVAELVAVLIGCGVEGRSALEVSQMLLSSCGGLAGLARSSYDELCAHRGLGPTKAARLSAAVELGKRLAQAPVDRKEQINGAQEAAAILLPSLSALVEEQIWVVLLSSRHRVIRVECVGQGTIDGVMFRAGSILRPAIIAGARAIILAHNHPSGEPSPSAQDIAATKALVDAGRLVGVRLLDHLIIAGGRYVSVRSLDVISGW